MKWYLTDEQILYSYQCYYYYSISLSLIYKFNFITMKLSSPSSAPLSLNSLPRGYFSKCTTNKSSGAKGTPLRSKQNIKSKVFNENK